MSMQACERPRITSCGMHGETRIWTQSNKNLTYRQSCCSPEVLFPRHMPWSIEVFRNAPNVNSCRHASKCAEFVASFEFCSGCVPCVVKFRRMGLNFKSKELSSSQFGLNSLHLGQFTCFRVSPGPTESWQPEPPALHYRVLDNPSRIRRSVVYKSSIGCTQSVLVMRHWLAARALALAALARSTVSSKSETDKLKKETGATTVRPAYQRMTTSLLAVAAVGRFPPLH